MGEDIREVLVLLSSSSEHIWNAWQWAVHWALTATVFFPMQNTSPLLGSFAEERWSPLTPDWKNSFVSLFALTSRLCLFATSSFSWSSWWSVPCRTSCWSFLWRGSACSERVQFCTSISQSKTLIPFSSSWRTLFFSLSTCSSAAKVSWLALWVCGFQLLVLLQHELLLLDQHVKLTLGDFSLLLDTGELSFIPLVVLRCLIWSLFCLYTYIRVLFFGGGEAERWRSEEKCICKYKAPSDTDSFT